MLTLPFLDASLEEPLYPIFFLFYWHLVLLIPPTFGWNIYSISHIPCPRVFREGQVVYCLLNVICQSQYNHKDYLASIFIGCSDVREKNRPYLGSPHGVESTLYPIIFYEITWWVKSKVGGRPRYETATINFVLYQTIRISIVQQWYNAASVLWHLLSKTIIFESFFKKRCYLNHIVFFKFCLTYKDSTCTFTI